MKGDGERVTLLSLLALASGPRVFSSFALKPGSLQTNKNTSLWTQASTLWCQTVWSGYREKLTLICCTQRLICWVDALIRGLSSPPWSRRQLSLEGKCFVFLFPKFLLGLPNGSQTEGTSAIASVASWQMVLLGHRRVASVAFWETVLLGI